MNKVSCIKKNWLNFVLESVEYAGYCIVEDVLSYDFLKESRAQLYEVQQKTLDVLGEERINKAGECGVLRLMMLFEPNFVKFLELPQVLEVIDNIVSNTAILHLQNGFILPSFPEQHTPSIFQNNFHPDFRRVLNGYMCSINILFAIDDFTKKNGGTLVVPGTHQKACSPSKEYLENNAIAVECRAGSMVVFDSTLWHAAGKNISGKDRLAINHQFTRSYFKQQFDYVRALGEEMITSQSPRTQQLLGYYTRVVTSLDEYYLPEQERLYRKSQG